MKIHTSLTYSDLCRALPPCVSFTRCEVQGSRSRPRAFDVILRGNSGRSQGFGGTEEGAAWDEWGDFLGALYRADPELGTPYYWSPEHYTWSTGGRFAVPWTPYRDARPYQLHTTHRWGSAGTVVTGRYSVRECACGAVQRWAHSREAWEVISADSLTSA